MVVDVLGQFAYVRAKVPLRGAMLALRIGVDPLEAAPMPNADFSRPCVPPALPLVPPPSRLLARPQLLTCARPLP
jgi:hypothetical protein